MFNILRNCKHILHSDYPKADQHLGPELDGFNSRIKKKKKVFLQYLSLVTEPKKIGGNHSFNICSKYETIFILTFVLSLMPINSILFPIG